MNCKSLEVLDAEEDSEMMTTDHGLSFLTNCAKLTTIILNDAGDEYDYEDRYFGITGRPFFVDKDRFRTWTALAGLVFKTRSTRILAFHIQCAICIACTCFFAAEPQPA